MEYTTLDAVYARINDLLRTYPLSSVKSYFQWSTLPEPPDDPADRFQWALTHLEIPKTEVIPFCSRSRVAQEDHLAVFLKNAKTMVSTVRLLAEDISRVYPDLRRVLVNLSEQCATYTRQAELQSVDGGLTLTEYRSIFRTYLSTAIQTCCDFLFGQNHRIVGAALLAPIQAHLAQIGVTTPVHDGSLFDYENYEPYYVHGTDREELDEHFESISLPAYFLGTSRLCSGKASCYSYQLRG